MWLTRPLFIGLSRPLISTPNGGSVIGPSYLDSRFGVTRAQVAGVRATALGADGMTRGEFGANVPRFNGAPRRLLIEGQRTNAVRNSRGEGGVPGTPGTPPTNWSVGATPGVTLTQVGSGLDAGIQYVDWRVQGTSTAAVGTAVLALVVGFETPAASPAVTVGQTWNLSVFMRLVGGTFPTRAEGQRLVIEERDAGSVLAFRTQQVAVTSAMTRFAFPQTIAAAGAVSARPGVWIYAAGGDVIDFTLRIGWPQMELGPFASTPILPLIGTPGASTRGADQVSAPLANLGIGANGACTILGTFMLPQLPVAGTSALLAQIDTGADANRVLLLVNSAGDVFAARSTATAYVASLSIATISANTTFAAGLTHNGAGYVAGISAGGVLRTVTGAPASGHTTLRLGNTVTGTSPMFGEVRSLTVIPGALSDADLQARVATLPLT